MAGLGGEVPDFDGLLDSDQPKDTEVTVVEEQQQGGVGQKRSRQGTEDNHITLGAHWVVLRSLSPYFRAKLERWSRDESNSKRPCTRAQQQQQSLPYQYSLQLLVPPGQLELGRRLITAMYSSSPDLSDLEAPQLMQLVALAECYGVGKVVAAAATQLHQLKVEAMPLDIAAAVFELPEACLALEAVQKVQQAAADKLQQELGDLEQVWANKTKQQQLLGLPFGALLQLLRNERTRVASEDTVVNTAQRWLRKNTPPAERQQQQQQLAGVFRLPHCTATFLAWLAGPTPLPEKAWVYDYNPRLLADLLAASGRSSLEQRKWLDRAYKDKASWRLPTRPVSAVSELELSWDLPLVELEQCLAAGTEETIGLNSWSHGGYWQGRRWWLAMNYTASNEHLKAFVWGSGAPAFVTAVIRLESAPGRRDQCRYSLKGSYICGVGMGGAIAVWGPGKEEWPQVKAWLQQEGLVHPDGCLHLRATVTHVS